MLEFSDSLEKLIIDLGLLPSALCTPSLIRVIDAEFRANLECEWLSEFEKKAALDFLKHFSHRSRNDNYYKEQSKIQERPFKELF